MSVKAIILIISVIAYIAINNHFIRNDEEFRQQTYDRKMFSDLLGIQRFRQQPKKMSILMGVLLGPISLYYLYQSYIAG